MSMPFIIHDSTGKVISSFIESDKLIRILVPSEWSCEYVSSEDELIATDE